MPHLRPGQDHVDRLAQLKAMLAARTDRTGKPHHGYAENVEALKDEIDEFESLKVTHEQAAQRDDGQKVLLDRSFLKFDPDGDGEPGGRTPKKGNE